MRALRKYDPFANFVVTKNVQALPGFNLLQLKEAIADIIELDKNGWHLDAPKPISFDLFGACLVMVFDRDELEYDLGAASPSSPLGFLTVMLASEDI